MPIPNVPLNVDPQGYAGSVVTPISAYGGGGMAPGSNPLLARIMRMRERQAEMELEMMRAKMEEPGRERAFQKEMFELQGYTDKQRRQQEKRERGGRAMMEDPLHAGAPVDMRASRMAEALVGPGTPGASRQVNPNILAQLTGMIGAIGPQAAHQGMMQSGRLLGSQGGAPASLGELRAGGMGETGVRPGGGYPYTPSRGAAMPPEQRGWEFDPTQYQNPRASILGSLKEGSSGVPKTGTYKLHKGEMVIPTKDVDPELVTYLTRKKIYERAFSKGKGKPIKSYQEGTLEDLFKLAETGDLAAFREILYEKGSSEEQADEIISKLTQGTKPGVRGKYIRNYFKALEEAPPEPEGGFLGSIAERLPAGLALPGAALRTVSGMQEGRPAAEALGAGLREQFGGAIGGAAEAAGGLFKGLTGAELGAGPEVGAQPVEEGLPSQQPLEDLAGPPPAEFPEGSYEAASARAQAGDFGTPEDPLVLRGELSDIERAQRDVERLPMYQEAKRKADTAEDEANAIFDMLAKEGRAMGPDVYSDLFSEAERKMKLSKGFRGITERQEKATQSMLTMNEKILQMIEKEEAKQKAIGDRQQQLEALRQSGRLTLTVVRGLARSLSGLFAAAAGGGPDQTRAEQQIAQIFKDISLYEEMRAQSSETRDHWRNMGKDAESLAEEFTKLDKDTALRTAEDLLARYSSTGELKGLMR